MKSLSVIMGTLDAWVKTRGNGQYPSERNSVPPFALPVIYGIQQNRDELVEFVTYLLEHCALGTALEIGLGRSGSTHVLWRMLFEKVVTVEMDFDRVNRFGEAFHSHFGAWPDERSRFVFGSSHLPETLAKARACTSKVDMLFIDGDHRAVSLCADWSLYSPLVRQGGLIAFHDAAPDNENTETIRFLQEFESGLIDGIEHRLTRIVKSGNQGIAYYVK